MEVEIRVHEVTQDQHLNVSSMVLVTSGPGDFKLKLTPFVRRVLASNPGRWRMIFTGPCSSEFAANTIAFVLPTATRS
jgi:hypothetical protein